jgi:hypothetical protein
VQTGQLKEIKDKTDRGFKNGVLKQEISQKKELFI